MLKRLTFVIVLTVLSALPGIANAADTTVPPLAELGKEFKGEIKGPAVYTSGTGDGIYTAKIRVKLKAEQDLSVTVTVKGDNRLAGLRLTDPDMKRVSASKVASLFRMAHANPATLEMKEASASGDYTIEVFSNKIGLFTLKATSTAAEAAEKNDKPSRDDLKRKLESLKKEIQEVEKQLEELDNPKRTKKSDD